jgi:selT/selW/selH-like putative selenoprotein
LFEDYARVLVELSGGSGLSATLRRFERALLAGIGYGLVLDRDASSGAAIDPGARYVYQVGIGPVPADGDREGIELTGQTLIDMAQDRYDAQSLQESKLQACMAAWFMGTVASQNLISTGAFEVYHDGAVIFSKLETGKAPDLNAIVEAVLNARRAALALGRGAQ